MSEQRDAWKPLGVVVRKIVADLEEKQREVFLRDCALEGLVAQSKEKTGGSNAASASVS